MELNLTNGASVELLPPPLPLTPPAPQAVSNAESVQITGE